MMRYPGYQVLNSATSGPIIGKKYRVKVDMTPKLAKFTVKENDTVITQLERDIDAIDLSNYVFGIFCAETICRFENFDIKVTRLQD